MKNLSSIVLVIFVLSLMASCVAPRAGAVFASEKVKFNSSEFRPAEGKSQILPTETFSETGFYVGVAFTEIEISDDFDFQPEVNFVAIKDLNQIQVPLLFRYNLTDEFNVLAGPNVGFLFDTGDGINSLNFVFDAGLSYDITEKFLVEARYGIGLSNLFEEGDSNNSLKLSGFQVGVAYRLEK